MLTNHTTIPHREKSVFLLLIEMKNISPIEYVDHTKIVLLLIRILSKTYLL